MAVGAMVAVAAHVAAGLVLIAGVGKVMRPHVTRDALALGRLPAAEWLVRALGLGEVALAVMVLAVGGRIGFGLLGLAYGGFAVVAERQRRAGRSCGCFGAASNTAVGPLHLGVDGVAAAAAFGAAFLAVPGLPGVLPVRPISGVVALGLITLAVVLGQLLLTSLPELLAVRATAAGERADAPMPAFSISGVRP